MIKWIIISIFLIQLQQGYSQDSIETNGPSEFSPLQELVPLESFLSFSNDSFSNISSFSSLDNYPVLPQDPSKPCPEDHSIFSNLYDESYIESREDVIASESEKIKILSEEQVAKIKNRQLEEYDFRHCPKFNFSQIKEIIYKWPVEIADLISKGQSSYSLSNLKKVITYLYLDENEDSLRILCNRNQEIVAALSVPSFGNDEVIILDQLAVHPRFLKKGVGTSAIRFLIQELLLQNKKTIKLKSKIGSQQFYYNLGFKRDDNFYYYLRRNKIREYLLDDQEKGLGKKYYAPLIPFVDLF